MPTSRIRSRANARIWQDIATFVVAWAVLFATSVWPIGSSGGFAFMGISAWLILRRPLNGIVLLLLLASCPVEAVGIPRPFAVLFLTATLGAVIRNVDFSHAAKSSITVASLAFCVLATALIKPDHLSQVVPYWEGFGLIVLVQAIITTRRDFLVAIVALVTVSAASTVVGYTHLKMGEQTAQYRAVANAPETRLVIDSKWKITSNGDRVRWIWAGAEPNYRALVLAFCVVVSAALFSSATSTRMAWFYAAVGVLTILGLLGTYSRSGFLSATIGVVLTIVSRIKFSTKIVFLIVVAAISVSIAMPAIIDRIATIGRNLRETGGTGRLAAWSIGIQIWEGSPIFGNGGETRYMMEGAVHNTFIEIAADFGIFGGLLFVAIVAVPFLNRPRVSFPSREYHLVSSALAFGLIAACCQAATVTLYDPVLLWLCAVLCFVFHRLNSRPRLRMQTS